jgi:broad-specificity NMP kinase
VAMKLILIYGPPGVGKLSVATALSASTGFKLFHNQLTVNCVLSVFDFNSSPFVKLVDKIRLEIFEEALREKIPGIIFTFVYGGPQDNKFIDNVEEIVKRGGGELLLVRLYCEKDELERRVVLESRKAYGKLVDREILKDLQEKYNLQSEIPGRESLSIDNTQLAPEEVLEKISSHYGLKAV